MNKSNKKIIFEEKYLLTNNVSKESPLYRFKILFERNPKYKQWYIQRISSAIERVVNVLEIKNGLFLDFGCGTGWLAVGVEKKAHCKCIGIDIEKDLISFSKKRVNYENGSSKFLLSSGENLPFKDESFDFVAAMDVLEHVEDYRLCIKEIIRVPKKRGKALLAFPNKFAIIFSGHTNLKVQVKNFLVKNGILKGKKYGATDYKKLFTCFEIESYLRKLNVSFRLIEPRNKFMRFVNIYKLFKPNFHFVIEK